MNALRQDFSSAVSHSPGSGPILSTEISVPVIPLFPRARISALVSGMKSPWLLTLVALATFSAPDALLGQAKKKKSPPPFSWVNEIPENQISRMNLPSGVSHQTFKSPSMGVEVGYYIYLPKGYESSGEKEYPVVFHLHGGRPGSEARDRGQVQGRAAKAGRCAVDEHQPSSFYRRVRRRA